MSINIAQSAWSALKKSALIFILGATLVTGLALLLGDLTGKDLMAAPLLGVARASRWLLFIFPVVFLLELIFAAFTKDNNS